jgi:hypothetical protein
MILGDSLAVGVGQARPECTVAAEVGINTARYLQVWRHPSEAGTVVISLGVNDSEDIETEQNLRILRRGLNAGRVYWLVPGIHPTARAAVQEIAREFGDRMIDVAPLTGADHIHPDRYGYAKLASLTRNGEDGYIAPRHRPYADMPPPTTAYHAFPTGNPAYRDFAARQIPGINVWRGPDNLNGLPVPPMPPKVHH